jgi:nicotinate phosphoribosyltransferase
MGGKAVFDLFIRRLKNRDFFVVAGVNQSLRDLQNLEFTQEERRYLRSLPQFEDTFIRWLSKWEFTCDVRGVRDGDVVYPNQPILQVSGPIYEAQLVETILLNRIQHETNVATKAAHIVRAAGGKPVADFGLRRAPNRDAALRGARAAYIGGVSSTSNVAAGKEYGIPVTGTMAHSYVEAHDSEKEAFREFATTSPGTVVLIDTYNTMAGVEKVVELLDEGCDIGGVRLDSGDLLNLSKGVRLFLDKHGYENVDIYASSGLDENKIRELEKSGAPIGAYGVGSKLQSVSDQPYADAVYKLSEYEGKGRMKLSSGKTNLPGEKQVWRNQHYDVIARRGEPSFKGKPLMKKLMLNGNVVAGRTLEGARDAASFAVENYADQNVNTSQSLLDYEQKIAKRLPS